jgi:hypothetical protein
MSGLIRSIFFVQILSFSIGTALADWPSALTDAMVQKKDNLVEELITQRKSSPGIAVDFAKVVKGLKAVPGYTIQYEYLTPSVFG